MERDGDGENLNFRAWWRVCGVGVGAGGAGVGVVVVSVVFRGCKVARLGGCKVASIATFKAYFCTSFVVVYYWVVGVFLYYWRVVPFRGWWRPCGLVGWWWWVGGLVVAVVGRDGRRYPPLELDSWNDKGVWNAEIFF